MNRPLRFLASVSIAASFAVVGCGGSVEPAPTHGPTTSTPAMPGTPGGSAGSAPASPPPPVGGIGDGASSIRVTEVILGAPCMGSWGGGAIPERTDLDMQTGALLRAVPDCGHDAGSSYVEVNHRTLTPDELASVQTILDGLHEGPYPGCFYDGPQASVEVTRSGGTTNYQDWDTNCYKAPGVKYLDTSLSPLVARLHALAVQ